MDRTLEGKLMRELDDAKHLLTDDEYLRWCNNALDARKFRHGHSVGQRELLTIGV